MPVAQQETLAGAVSWYLDQARVDRPTLADHDPFSHYPCSCSWSPDPLRHRTRNRLMCPESSCQDLLTKHYPKVVPAIPFDPSGWLRSSFLRYSVSRMAIRVVGCCVQVHQAKVLVLPMKRPTPAKETAFLLRHRVEKVAQVGTRAYGKLEV